MRVTDGSAGDLIRTWLEAIVVDRTPATHPKAGWMQEKTKSYIDYYIASPPCVPSLTRITFSRGSIKIFPSPI